MSHFDDAFGHGPNGPSYRPPAVKRRTVVGRIKAWAWYRWGWGHRPQPQYAAPDEQSRRHRD